MRVDRFRAVRRLWLVAATLLPVLSSAQTESNIAIDPPPGRYGADTALTVISAVHGQPPSAAFVDLDSGAELTRFRVREPLMLSAAPGEERLYRLVVEAAASDGSTETAASGAPSARRQLDYIIDRRAPATPVLSPAGGTFQGAVEISLAAMDTDGVELRYAVDGNPLFRNQRWGSSPMLLSAPAGERRAYRVAAFAQDAVGNRSRVVSATYDVDARHLAAPTLEVLSPVAGTFGNRQRLVIESSNVRWIRYALDGRDPIKHGVEYQGPVELSITGEIQLRVVARPLREELNLLERSVALNVVAEEAPRVVASSVGGVVSEGFQLLLSSPVGASLYYSLDDKTPDEFDVLYSDAIEFTGFPGSRKLVPLRVRAQLPEAQWGAERRLLFDLDNRVPPRPTIAVRAGSGRLTVTISGAPAAVTYYTLDGTEPDVGSRLYLSPFAVEEGTEVRAVAVSAAGRRGPTAMQTAMLASPVALPPPQVTVVEGAPGNGVVTVSVTAAADSPPGTRLHFESTSGYGDASAPATPGLDSPPAPPSVRFAVPRGDRRMFRLSAAAIGATGEVSTPVAVAVAIDRTPAACSLPTVTEDEADTDPGPGTALLIDSGSGATRSGSRVHYTLSNDGSVPSDPSAASAVLDQVRLAGRADERVVYRMKVLCRSDAGNESDVLGPLELVVDRRLPRVPVLRGFIEGALYADSEVSLEYREEPNLRLHYEVTTDGSDPPAPTAASPLLTPSTMFGGTEGATTTFRVSILPVSSAGEEGPIETVSFSVDRDVPSPPFVSGFEDGAVYARPVAVVAVSPTLGNRLYVAVTRDGPTEQLIARSNLYSGTIEVDVAENEETTFFVEAAEVDDAGNQSARVSRRFSIDRRPPKAPAVRGIPPEGVVGEPALVQIAGGTPNIFYELTSDGSTPAVPGLVSQRYIEPLALAGAPGAEVLYQLRVRAIDAVGNLSPLGPIHGVVVDRAPPPRPPAPTVQSQVVAGTAPAAVAAEGVAGEGAASRLVLSWDPAEVYDLEWALLPVGGTDPTYAPYEEPVVVTLPERGGLMAWARRTDAAGNSSAVVQTLLAEQSVPAAPRVVGVANGVVYREAANVTFATEHDALVRVEVATGGAEPAPVSDQSAIATGEVTFDAMSGETVDYTVRARAFDPAGVAVSAETRVAFTVDRTPLAPPVLLGAEDGDHYADDVELTLLSGEGEIRYALVRAVVGEDAAVRGDLDLSLPATETFGRYEDSLVLPRQPGEIVSYRLAAYVVDDVGNSSTGLVEWTITIDDRVFYVAPGGSDEQTGTRTAPCRSLAHAIREAQRAGKREVHAAAGDYVVDRTLILGGDMLLIGGFDTADWDRLGLEHRSNLLPGRFIGPGDPLLAVTGGQVDLRRIGLSDRDAPPKMPVVQVSDGQLELADSEVLLTGQGGVAVRVDGGFVRIVGSELAASPQGAPLSLVRQRQGALLLSRSRLFGPAHGDEFAAVSISGTDDATLDRVTVDPGGALRTVGVAVVGSQVLIEGGVLRSGAGNIRAVALSADRATVTLRETEVSADAAAGYPIAIEGSDADITLEGVTLKLAGQLGTTGVRLRSGELLLQASTVTSQPTTEFSTLLDTAEASGLVANSILVAGNAGESMVANVRGGRMDWVNNTLVGASGRTLTAGIRVAGSGELTIVNNILARPRLDASVAVAVLGVSPAARLPIVANNLAGWDLVMSPVAGTARDLAAVDAALVDALNLADGDPFGGPFHANIGEPLERTFRVTKESALSGVYQLLPGAGSVNAGVPFASGLNAPAVDFLGRERPAPFVGLRPAPDLGALELY